MNQSTEEKNILTNKANYMQWVKYYKQQGNKAQVKFYSELVEECDELLKEIANEKAKQDGKRKNS